MTPEPKTIAVVNDDQTQLCLISRVLAKEGYDTATYTDSALAYEQLCRGPVPDLIITDIQMPGIDGWRFCRMIRANDNDTLRRVPILAISAVFTSTESERVSKDIGADDFLILPFSGADLVSKVGALLQAPAQRGKPLAMLIGFHQSEMEDLSSCFSRSGYAVRCYSNRREGIAQIDETMPQIVVAECHTGADRADFQGTRIHERHPNMVLVIVRSGDDPAIPADRGDADECLTRPFSSEYLILSCEKAMRERSLLKVEELLGHRTWELEEIRLKYESMMASVEDSFYICSSDYTVEYAVDAGWRESGSREASPCYTAIYGRTSVCPWCRLSEVLEGKAARFEFDDTDNGRSFHVSASPLRHADGTTSQISIVREITEEKNLRARLKQAEKLEAIGQLAGGVAHDFNNMLGTILGYADIVRETNLDENELPHDGILHKRMEAVIAASKRASGLVSQLLAFSRQGKYRNVPIDVCGTVEEVVRLLERTIDKRIRIATDLDRSCPRVVGDPQQIESALLNLAVNARDAMPEGGELCFSVGHDELAEDWAHQRELTPGTHVKICVSDTGCGIPLEIRDKIFDPFFSTKQLGKGTGLGLAGAYGTVKNHGGSIEVESEMNRGSTFTVYLPASTQPNSEATVDADRPRLVRGKGRVMLVDDEDMVREVAEEYLLKAGYTVEAFGNAREAVEYYAKCHATIDAVVIDMVMPELNGSDCLREMSRVSNGVRAVMATGYCVDTQTRELQERDGVVLVQKPFTSHELTQAVAECMNGTPAAVTGRWSEV